jgi:hypothetical protein
MAVSFSNPPVKFQADCQLQETLQCSRPAAMDEPASNNATDNSARQPKKKMAHAVTDAEGNVRYRCLVCKKLFNKNYNLRAHSRLHTGERPFACDAPGCDKSFLWKSSLTSHRAAHKRDFQQAERYQNVVLEGERRGMVNTLPPRGWRQDTAGRSLGPRHSAPIPQELKEEDIAAVFTVSPTFGCHETFPQPSSESMWSQIEQRPTEIEFAGNAQRFAANASPGAFQRGRDAQSCVLAPQSLAAAMLELEAIITPSLQTCLSPRTSPRNNDFSMNSLDPTSPWHGGAQTNELHCSPLVSFNVESRPVAWSNLQSKNGQHQAQRSIVNAADELSSTARCSISNIPAANLHLQQQNISAEQRKAGSEVSRAQSLKLAAVAPPPPLDLELVHTILSPDEYPSEQRAAGNTFNAPRSSFGNSTLDSQDIIRLTGGPNNLGETGSRPAEFANVNLRIP